MIFDADEPNALGIGCMVSFIFYVAYLFSDNLASFVCVMLVCTSITCISVMWSVHNSVAVRTAVKDLLS